MYIHSYQIHNVLNVYRKQLSQGTLHNNSASPAKTSFSKDTSIPSIEAQRQSMIEKISDAIVDRITQFRPQAQAYVEPAALTKGDANPPQEVDADSQTPLDDAAFTYTTIDEHNQKQTNTLTVHAFGSPAIFAGSSGRPEADSVDSPEAE